MAKHNYSVFFVLALLYGLAVGLKEEHTKVVIIGAGAAGIAVADQLQKGGIQDFVVLRRGVVGGCVVRRWGREMKRLSGGLSLSMDKRVMSRIS